MHYNIIDNPDLGPYSLTRKLKETTKEEMKKPLALSLLMGIIKKPNIHNY